MASKRSRGLILLLLLMVPSLLSDVPFMYAVEGDPTPVGFEFLDGGGILRIWNELDSYYFNTSSGVQFSNHYNEYWSKNVLGLGYYSGGSWNPIYWTDSLSGFKKDLKTDWETYLNITLWKDLTYSGYDFRLAVRYHLKTKDPFLTIQPYIKNLGKNIPFDIGFAWRVKDIKISDDVYNDEFQTSWMVDENTTNGESYYLNQILDKSYNNNTGYLIKDTSKSQTLEFYWTEEIAGKFFLKVKSLEGQCNAPITLYVNAGPLSIDQEKSTDFLWHDADLIDSYSEVNYNAPYDYPGLHPSADGNNSGFGQSFNQTQGTNRRITSAKFYLYKTGTPTGNAHAVLYTHSGTFGTSSLPTGVALATSDDFDVSTLGVGSGNIALVTFSFTGAQQYEMVAGAKYVICYENPTSGFIDESNYVSSGHDTSPSHGGNFMYYDNSAWHSFNSWDEIFYVYGEAVGGNNAPSTDASSITNMDDSDNLYSQLRDYNLILNVSDADGIAELDFIQYALEIGTGWINGTIDAQSNVHTFQAGSSNCTVGAVTNETTATTANYTVPIKFDWDIISASDNDIHLWVNDTVGDDSGWSEVQTDYFDTVNDLVISGFACDDDRGNIGTTIIFSGTVYYENDPSSGIATTFYPPDAEFTSVDIHNSTHNELGTDNSIVNGFFTAAVTAESTVGIETYHPYIDMADADYLDGDETPTDTYIADQIVAYSEALDDTRVDINTNIEWRIKAVLDYDDHDLGAGDGISCSWGALAWDAGNSWFDISHSEATVQGVTITLTSGSEATYGITAFSENITETTGVFDQQQLQTLGVNNSTPAANENVTIWATSQSPFDNHVLGAGDTLVLEDTDADTYSMSYNGSHWIWVGSWPANGTITINTYDSVNEATYGITGLGMNSLSLVITVGTSPPPSGNTFDLQVITSDGVGIENANVRLYNASDLFSVNTNSTGQIAQQTFDSGNYTLTILRTGYLLYNHTYSWTTSVNLVVALTTDTELAGLGILPVFLGFMGLVVILAANRRRR